jgi:type IV pilus assembly protein PilB
LQEAASTFKISLVKETDQGEEVLDLDRLASDSEMSPIIKLVDTVIYNAMESRASDIHIEAHDREMLVKFRIDGALYQKVDPIDIAYHQTLISRIKAEQLISAFRLCPPRMVKTVLFVFSTKSRFQKNSKI